MGVLALPSVAQLGDRPLLARRDEDRVVPEAARTAPLERDRAVQDTRADELGAVRRERDEPRHHPRAAVRLAPQPLEQRIGLVAARRPARRVQARLAAEGLA